MTTRPFRYTIGLLLLAAVPSFAQTTSMEDPNIDSQLGVLPPEAFQRQVGSHAVEVITSADGYDNFDLGVDFAEPHMSNNPVAPTEYFNAFNINGTHHTEDGHDWATNDPVFANAAGDPVTAYDNVGNLYYMTMRVSGFSIIGTWVVKSTNNGVTWGTPVSSVAGFDKCWMAADQTDGPYAGYVYGVMTPGNFSRTTNGGTSWVQTWTAPTQTLPGMMVAVGPDHLNGDVDGGCVYVVTNSGSVTSSTYTFYRSTDGGSTFSWRSTANWAGYIGSFVGGRHSVENSRTRPYPFISADNSDGPYRGRLYSVYAANDPPGNGNKPDIWIRYSDDQGTTWSSATRINDDPNPTTNHQWTPAVWTDFETGRVYAKWYDTRESSPADDSTDVFASYSDDGGVTWATNQKLTTRKFKINCATCGGSGTPRYQGDYDAITSNSVTSLSVWTDFRNGTFMSTTAYLPDYAMLLSDDSFSGQPTGSAVVTVDVPSVKLYDNTVTFSAEVDPPAAFSFDWPDGNTLSSYPDSRDLEISWTGVPDGEYTVTIQGEGPNGTPVHRRTATVEVSPAAIACGDFTFFQARCTSSNKIQSMVRLSSNYDGQTVTLEVDGTPYDITLMGRDDKSIGRLTVAVGPGIHTVEMVDPSGCYPEPIEVDCGTTARADAEFDALWAEFDGMELATPELASETGLIDNFPNPFNPSTTLRFNVGEPGAVSLKIYNTLGQLVRTLVDEHRPEGVHEIVWDGRNETGSTVSSGIYVYRLTAGNVVETRKMMLMK